MRPLFTRYDIPALAASPGFTLNFQMEQSAAMIAKLNRETERWMRMALERGEGWSVWRSASRSGEGVGGIFTMIHDFALLEPGAPPPVGPGYLFHQPELTDGERVRLLAGRHDWREHQWQDECGVADCGHPSCERARA